MLSSNLGSQHLSQGRSVPFTVSPAAAGALLPFVGWGLSPPRRRTLNLAQNSGAVLDQ